MEEAMTADILEDAFEPIVARIEALAFIRYETNTSISPESRS